MSIVLTKAHVVAVVRDFFEHVDEEDRAGLDEETIDIAAANAELAKLPDADQNDVAEAIWNALPDADEVLPDECFAELANAVERSWSTITGGAS